MSLTFFIVILSKVNFIIRRKKYTIRIRRRDYWVMVVYSSYTRSYFLYIFFRIFNSYFEYYRKNVRYNENFFIKEFDRIKVKKKRLREATSHIRIQITKTVLYL